MATRHYAGSLRTEQGIERHRAARRARNNKPVQRIKSDIASVAAKRKRAVNGTGTTN